MCNLQIRNCLSPSFYYFHTFRMICCGTSESILNCYGKRLLAYMISYHMAKWMFMWILFYLWANYSMWNNRTFWTDFSQCPESVKIVETRR
jgi:hypothetical protein